MLTLDRRNELLALTDELNRVNAFRAVAEVLNEVDRTDLLAEPDLGNHLVHALFRLGNLADALALVIALEEHYADPEVTAHGPGIGRGQLPEIVARLNDLGDGRLRAMDGAGIDLQVISHAPSPLQQLDPAEARELTTATNDRRVESPSCTPTMAKVWAITPSNRSRVCSRMSA